MTGQTINQMLDAGFLAHVGFCVDSHADRRRENIAQGEIDRCFDESVRHQQRFEPA
jgi:hypothetical protein